jgi:hypothetical protein
MPTTCDAEAPITRERRPERWRLVREVVVCRIGAGELGIASDRRNRVRAEHGRLRRDIVLGAVEVPGERPPEVLGVGVLLGVQRHQVNLGWFGRLGLAHVVELLGEGDLGLVVDVELAKDQRAVLLESLHARRWKRVIHQQLVDLDAEDLGSDVRSKSLGREGAHGRAPF